MCNILKRSLRRTVFYIILLAVLLTAIPISASAENGKYVIVLDPGHGGIDGGTDEAPRTEKVYNLLLAQYIKAELEADGNFEVHLTRENDIYLKYLHRALFIIEHNADVLISLHCNSIDYSYVSGCDAFVSVADDYGGAVLAGMILDNISAAVPIKRGRVQYREDTGDSLGIYYWNSEKKWDMPSASWLGKKSDYYSMSTWSSKFGVSSIIVEHGYLSNPSDAAIIDSDENLRAIAKAEAEAIIEFFTGHEHTYTAEKVVDFPSNCTLTGTKSYRCTICGAKNDTESLPAAPDAHYYRCTESRAVTCTTDGYAKYLCQISFNLNDKGYDCEVHSYTETATATGHSYTVVENVPATHGSNGVKKTVCQNCGDTVTEIITGDAHDYTVTEETPPTCTAPGSKTSLCSVCDYEKTESLPALGHDFEVKENVPPQPEADGYILSVCSHCGEEKTEIIPRCAHEYVIDQVEADCDTAGAVNSLCSLCGYEKTESLPALGHDLEALSETPPSCELSGVRSVECRICGMKKDELIPATGHSFETTEERWNKTVKTCSTCGIVTEEASGNNTVAVVIIGSAAVIATAIAALFWIRRRAAARNTGSASAENEVETTDHANDAEELSTK